MGSTSDPQEDQESKVAVTGHQLILKMSSEDQTVDHTNSFMGNDHQLF